ncbi:hypothetical protein L1857_09165 [Amycolatopsis thermalba]|uniref:Uncharacterized protein n=1 Tax=Amycolatopsis thermalba TaxID=944492 RepID=A0ABY4NSD8_9PSEU|nr:MULTISPECIES: hypothetical protein [Amycolatopsis]UQS22975.1 hypothetical protein L1857_09165 [Amycolatopsis thermalba]
MTGTARGWAAPAAAGVLDSPPAEPLSAFAEGRRIAVHGPEFDARAASRLRAETLRLTGVAAGKVVAKGLEP